MRAGGSRQQQSRQAGSRHPAPRQKPSTGGGGGAPSRHPPRQRNPELKLHRPGMQAGRHWQATQVNLAARQAEPRQATRQAGGNPERRPSRTQRIPEPRQEQAGRIQAGNGPRPRGELPGSRQT